MYIYILRYLDIICIFGGGMKMFLIKESQNMQIPPCRSEVGEFFRAYDSELKGSRVFYRWQRWLEMELHGFEGYPNNVL